MSPLFLSAWRVAALPPTRTRRLDRQDLTNAERIQRGLPLKAPIKRYDSTQPHGESSRDANRIRRTSQ